MEKEMLSKEKSSKISKSWTVLCISVSILKAIQAFGDKNIDPVSEQLLEVTILELSKSVLKLNNGQWD